MTDHALDFPSEVRRPRNPLTRLALDRGGPRDLAAIRDGAEAASGLARRLDTVGVCPVEIADAVGRSLGSVKIAQVRAFARLRATFSLAAPREERPDDAR